MPSWATARRAGSGGRAIRQAGRTPALATKRPDGGRWWSPEQLMPSAKRARWGVCSVLRRRQSTQSFISYACNLPLARLPSSTPRPQLGSMATPSSNQRHRCVNVRARESGWSHPHSHTVLSAETKGNAGIAPYARMRSFLTRRAPTLRRDPTKSGAQAQRCIARNAPPRLSN